MKSCKKFSLTLVVCAAFFMTGCDAQQILTTIENIAKGVQQAMPAIRDAVNTFQNVVNNNNNNNTAANNQPANNNPPEENTQNQANVNVTNPNQEDIAGTPDTNANTGTNNTNTNTGNTDTTNTNNNTTDTTTQNDDALTGYNGGRLTPSEFGQLLGPVAKAASQKSGVPASIILAQAALETGWGSSSIGSARNLFGIKGTGPAGSVSVPTREFINGRMVTVQASFRKYNSWQESIEDHSRLLTTAARYSQCMANRNNPDQFARELQKAGYATDPQYASKLISIMKSNNFYQYNN